MNTLTLRIADRISCTYVALGRRAPSEAQDNPPGRQETHVSHLLVRALSILLRLLPSSDWIMGGLTQRRGRPKSVCVRLGSRIRRLEGRYDAGQLVASPKGQGREGGREKSDGRVSQPTGLRKP